MSERLVKCDTRTESQPLKRTKCNCTCRAEILTIDWFYRRKIGVSFHSSLQMIGVFLSDFLDPKCLAPKISIIRERHGTSQISSSNEAQAHPNLSARICAKRPHDHCMKGHGWFLTTWTNHFKNLWSLLCVLPIFEKTPSSMSPKYFSRSKKCCCLEYTKHH